MVNVIKLFKMLLILNNQIFSLHKKELKVYIFNLLSVQYEFVVQNYQNGELHIA